MPLSGSDHLPGPHRTGEFVRCVAVRKQLPGGRDSAAALDVVMDAAHPHTVPRASFACRHPFVSVDIECAQPPVKEQRHPLRCSPAPHPRPQIRRSFFRNDGDFADRRRNSAIRARFCGIPVISEGEEGEEGEEGGGQVSSDDYAGTPACRTM